MAPKNCREIIRAEVKGCVANLNNRKVAEPDKIVNEKLKNGVVGMITMIAILYNWSGRTSTHPRCGEKE